LTHTTQVIAERGGVVSVSGLAGVVARQTPSGMVNAPLGVSVARGLATVCALQRITVYDLEDQDGASSDEEMSAEGDPD